MKNPLTRNVRIADSKLEIDETASTASIAMPYMPEEIRMQTKASFNLENELKN